DTLRTRSAMAGKLSFNTFLHTMIYVPIWFVENHMNEPKPIISVESVPARRIRHDGWTVERQEKFLKALAACGCIIDSCRSVGMSRQSANTLYNHPAAVGFRRAFDAALDSAVPMAVEGGAWERAVKGVARP